MKQRASRYEKIMPKQVELPSWGKEHIKLYRRLKENIKSNERELKCKRCGLYRRYQHPKTGKVYKLCANCGWEALVKLRDHIDEDKDKRKK